MSSQFLRDLGVRLLCGVLTLPGIAGIALCSAQESPKATPDPDGISNRQRKQIERLEALGYVGAIEPPMGDSDGVITHDRERVQSGVNLLTSGHGPVAILMDMRGNELHRWTHSFDEAFPDAPKTTSPGLRHWWRRACLLANGDLLAIFEGHGLIKLNKDSELIWGSPLRAHHDLKVMPGGEIVVLTRQASITEYLGIEQPIIEDFVSFLDTEGNETSRVSIRAALGRSEFHFLEDDNRGGDIYHTNSLQILDGSFVERVPAFRRGNILTSFRRLGAIAVLDPEHETVVWAQTGFTVQHDPELLPNGNVLVFDNGRAKTGSRVVEIDPVSQETRWEYRGTKDDPFFSKTCGTAQRLENGNTLITDSNHGRAFEVTPEGLKVWEYRSPFRSGKKKRLVSRISEMLRLPHDYVSSWLVTDED